MSLSFSFSLDASDSEQPLANKRTRAQETERGKRKKQPNQTKPNQKKSRTNPIEIQPRDVSSAGSFFARFVCLPRIRRATPHSTPPSPTAPRTTTDGRPVGHLHTAMFGSQQPVRFSDSGPGQSVVLSATPLLPCCSDFARVWVSWETIFAKTHTNLLGREGPRGLLYFYVSSAHARQKARMVFSRETQWNGRLVDATIECNNEGRSELDVS